MMEDIFTTATNVEGMAPMPAVGNNELVNNNINNGNDNDQSVNSSSNSSNSGGSRNSSSGSSSSSSSSSSNNNKISGDFAEFAAKDKKERMASSPSSIMTASLSPPSSQVAPAKGYEGAHDLEPEDYDALVKFLEFGEDDDDDSYNADNSHGNGCNNNGDGDCDDRCDDGNKGTSDGNKDINGGNDGNDGNDNGYHGFLSTGEGGDCGDQLLGQDPSAFSDGLDFEFDPNDDDPSGSFISLLPDSTMAIFPIIPSFDAATAGPADDDGVLPTAPAATPISNPGTTKTACEDGEDGTSLPAATGTAGPALESDGSRDHLPCLLAAQPAIAASGTTAVAPASAGVEASAKSGNGEDGRGGGEAEAAAAAAAAASLMLISGASTGHLSPLAAAPVTEAPRTTVAAPVSAGGDTTEKSRGVSGASRETAEQEPIASAPAPSLKDLYHTSFGDPKPGFSFPSTVQAVPMPPPLVYQYEDFDMTSVLGSALDVNLHVSHGNDGRKTEFSRAVSRRHAQSRIADALTAAAADKTHPPPASPSMDVVADALADCMAHQLFLKEPMQCEAEGAFSDGVAVRGNLGRAIKDLKEEESRRREAEARATLTDVKRRSSLRRLRSAGISRGRKERPKWDYLSLRKEWKDGNLLTL